MPIESPTNCWTEALDWIAAKLAANSRWREILQAADEAEALAKTFGQAVADPVNGNAYTLAELQELRAYCQVYSAPDQPFGVSEWQSNYTAAYGSAIVFVERLIPDANVANYEVPAEADRWLENRVGDVMVYLRGFAEGPHIRAVEVTDGPGYNPRDKWVSEGCWQGVEFRVDYGWAAGGSR